MQKMLLNSILIATLVIPTLAARDPIPRRGLKKALAYVALFDFAYLIGVLYIYPRLS